MPVAAPLTPIRETLLPLGVTALCGGLAWLLSPFVTESDQVMIFLVGVVFVAYKARPFAATLTALLGVATFNFFFVPPIYTLVVDETRYWLTFVAMALLGLMVSSLVWRVRAQAEQREELVEEKYRAELSLETERLRNSLLSSISHDLRTPVGSIVGSAELLLDEGLELEPARRHELIGSVHSEAHRLQQLLTNLLEMTRIEGGGLRLQRDWHLAEEIVGAALHRMERLLKGRTVLTRVEPTMVFVDERSMTTALANLVENGAKFSPEGACIWVSSRVDDDGYWCVEVGDEGIGLEGVDIGALFQKFHRGENAADVVGSGLGLSIVEAVIAAHGGEVFARNREDVRGALFGFRIDQSRTPKPPVVDWEEFGEL